MHRKNKKYLSCQVTVSNKNLFIGLNTDYTMDLSTLLLMNGFFLSFLLLVLLIIFANKGDSSSSQDKRRVSDDLKKIKAQVEDEGEEE